MLTLSSTYFSPSQCSQIVTSNITKHLYIFMFLCLCWAQSQTAAPYASLRTHYHGSWSKSLLWIVLKYLPQDRVLLASMLRGYCGDYNQRAPLVVFVLLLVQWYTMWGKYTLAWVCMMMWRHSENHFRAVQVKWCPWQKWISLLVLKSLQPFVKHCRTKTLCSSDHNFRAVSLGKLVFYGCMQW